MSARAQAIAVLALASALAALAGSAGAEQTATVEVQIGGLTLGYDPTEWRVDAVGSAYVIACVAESCDGVALDVTVTPDPTGYCDTDEAWATAGSLFPSADYHAVNTYALGDLALVMTQSRIGVALNGPTAVFACLTREGRIYRFQSRSGDAPFSQYTGGLVLELFGGLSAPPAPVVDVRVGDIVVSYRADVWRGAPPEPGDDLAVLHCLPPTCADFEAEVVIGAAEGEADCLARIADDPYWQNDDWPQELTVGAPGAELFFRMGAFWSGCRNVTPPWFLACAVHDGMTYRVEAPGGAGCRSGHGVPLDAFTALVESVRLAP